METREDMVKIHPQGDTVIILRNTDGSPLQDWPDRDESNNPETIPDPADGRYHIREYDLSARAMWIVLQLAHWQTDITPLDTTFSLYMAVNTIIHLYRLETVLAFRLETMAERKSVYWLFMAWTLKNWSDFRPLAVLIMAKSTTKIDFVDLPFPASVKAKLNSHRSSAIDHLLSHMGRLLRRLTEGLERYSEACNAMLLGSLLRGLHRAGLVGRVQGGPDTTEGLSFEQVFEAAEYIKTVGLVRWRSSGHAASLQTCGPH
ncbi:hypothetical protein BKA63DRAFT_559397 [Paraphoma chrysanthemicola]|nr:hypothetical protein BKA63DRAFT_559397 [Paraphoma chrysanthemicola]